MVLTLLYYFVIKLDLGYESPAQIFRLMMFGCVLVSIFIEFLPV